MFTYSKSEYIFKRQIITKPKKVNTKYFNNHKNRVNRRANNALRGLYIDLNDQNIPLANNFYEIIGDEFLD